MAIKRKYHRKDKRKPIRDENAIVNICQCQFQNQSSDNNEGKKNIPIKNISVSLSMASNYNAYDIMYFICVNGLVIDLKINIKCQFDARGHNQLSVTQINLKIVSIVKGLFFK